MNIVTLTPSEFMLAVHQQSLSPIQLSKKAGISTLKMRSFYNVQDGDVNESNLEIVIGGVRQPKITVTEPAKVWSELLNIVLKQMEQGKTFELALKWLLDHHYGKFIDVDDESTSGIKALFDQVYYFLLYFEVSDRKMIEQ